MGIPYHLTCLLKNLCAGQEATVRTGHGKKGLVQNWESKKTKLYIVTLLIKLIIRVHLNVLACVHLACVNLACEMPEWMNCKLESRLPKKCQ